MSDIETRLKSLEERLVELSERVAELESGGKRLNLQFPNNESAEKAIRLFWQTKDAAGIRYGLGVGNVLHISSHDREICDSVLTRAGVPHEFVT